MTLYNNVHQTFQSFFQFSNLFQNLSIAQQLPGPYKDGKLG